MNRIHYPVSILHAIVHGDTVVGISSKMEAWVLGLRKDECFKRILVLETVLGNALGMTIDFGEFGRRGDA